MKIKDTLDLCGWELWNFCIQNHQNLEGLLDLGAGRKVFYTGNDQGKNGREVIYDGSKWKVSAYTSDVDELRGLITALESATDEEIEALKGRATSLEGRATTTEDNLSTLKERVDAFLDGGVDSDAVLENLKEIQAFLDAYDGATSLAEILDTKLDTSGGVITLDSSEGLTIKRNTDDGASIIKFSNKKGTLGYLGINSTAPIYLNASGNLSTLLHSGNYSDLITTLNGDLSIGGAVNVGTGGLRVQGNLNVPIEINGSSIKRYGRGGGYLLSDDYYGLTPTKRLVQVGVFANDDELNFYCIGNRIESSAGGERWFTINSASSAFYVPTSFSSGITTNELTIGGIRLSVENGLLKIEGSAFATGELAAGGAGAEGNGGAGGFSLYESWGTSAPTEPLALGANLGYELKTRVEDLELAKTKVEISDTLVSGKPIGAITIDGNKTNLFAPATYAWSEITGTENVLLKSGGIIKGTGADLLGINRTDGYPTIVFYHNDSTMGRLGFDTSGNPVAQIGGTYYNILTSAGGTIEGASGNYTPLIVKTTSLSEVWIAFEDNVGTTHIGSVKGVPSINSGSGNHTLLHSGNVGDYALKTDGSNGMNYGANITWGDENANLEDYEGYSSGFRLLHYSTSSVEYSGGIHVGTRYGWQLVRNANTETMRIRYINPDDKSWGNWKTIAFTDSDITGNAATATNADQLDGKHLTDIMNIGYDNTLDLDTLYSAGALIARYWVFANSSNISNQPWSNSAAQVWTLPGSYNLQIAKFYNSNDIRLRGRSGEGWTNWQRLAFTDSTVDKAKMLVSDNGSLVVKANDNQRLEDYRNLQIYESGTTGADAYPYYQSFGSPTQVATVLQGGSLVALKTNGNERVWVNSSGNVTIGDSDLAGSNAKLHIEDTRESSTYILNARLFSPNLLAGGTSVIVFGKSESNKNRAYIGYTHNSDGSDSNAITFGFYGKDKIVNFLANGKVGIGTTDPQAKLDVAGSTRILGTLSANTAFNLNRNADKGDIFDSGKVAFELETFANLVRFRTFNPDVNNALTFYGSQGNVGIGKIAYTHKLEVEGNARIIGGLIVDDDLYANALAITGTSTFGGQSTFNAQSVFNAPVIIKDENTLQIGDAVLMWDKDKKVLTVNKSFASTGEISAGGTGTEGGNTGGGGTGTITNPDVEYYNPKDNATHTFYHNLPYYDVVVQVYEKNAISGAWDMILADVTIANESNLVTVNFGRKENVEHKIVVR